MKILLFLIVLPVMLFGQYNKLTPLSSYVRKGSFGTGTEYWTKSSATGFDFGSSTDFTIAMNFKTTSAATLQRLIAKKTNASGGSDPGFMIEIRNSKIQVNIGDASATAQIIGNVTLQNGYVYNLVVSVTRTGSAVIYLNGTVDNSGSVSTVGSITNALALGIGSSISGSNPMLGVIGHIQVVSGKAFTSSEAASMYAKIKTDWPKNYPGGTTVLDIDWKYLGKDKSSNNNTATSTGSPFIGTY